MTDIEIIAGIRGEPFHNFIKNLLSLGKLKECYIKKILSNENNIKLYNDAFTHSSVNSLTNYEFWEILGDATINKCVVWYVSRRFPELNNPEGVGTIARLKINLVSKKSFADIALNNEFEKFITISKEASKSRMKTLEDIFEAFIGVTEYIIDNDIVMSSGYSVCYNIITHFFDKIKISTNHDDIYDNKTKLNELVDKRIIIDDMFLVGIVYEDFMEENSQEYSSSSPSHHAKSIIHGIFEDSHSFNPTPKKIVIGEGIGCLKPEAQQMAAKHSIAWLSGKKVGDYRNILKNLLSKNPEIINIDFQEISRGIYECFAVKKEEKIKISQFPSLNKIKARQMCEREGVRWLRNTYKEAPREKKIIYGKQIADIIYDETPRGFDVSILWEDNEKTKIGFGSGWNKEVAKTNAEKYVGTWIESQKETVDYISLLKKHGEFKFVDTEQTDETGKKKGFKTEIFREGVSIGFGFGWLELTSRQTAAKHALNWVRNNRRK